MQASHIPRRRTEPENRVLSIESDQQHVSIEWHDGHRSAFHPVWLRDNCSCEECGDHSGGHRFFELNMLPASLENQITHADGLIKIVWLADNHTTSYDPAWLRSHCNSNQERSKRREKPVKSALRHIALEGVLPWPKQKSDCLLNPKQYEVSFRLLQLCSSCMPIIRLARRIVQLGLCCAGKTFSHQFFRGGIHLCIAPHATYQIWPGT